MGYLSTRRFFFLLGDFSLLADAWEDNRGRQQNVRYEVCYKIFIQPNKRRKNKSGSFFICGSRIIYQLMMILARNQEKKDQIIDHFGALNIHKSYFFYRGKSPQHVSGPQSSYCVVIIKHFVL